MGQATMLGLTVTRDQAEKMIAAIVNAKDVDPNSGQASNQSIDWTAVVAQAANFLSPEHFTVFKMTDPVGEGRTSGRFSSALNAALDQARASEATMESEP
jgi:hypothetical protein